MKNFKIRLLILVFLTINYELSTINSFAATEIPTTATATVAPEGQYGPVINAADQTLREGKSSEFEVLATDANTEDTVHLQISQGQPPWLSIANNTDGNPAKMILTAAPPMGSVGSYRVYFTATDNSPYNLSANKDIYLIVSPANQPPVITVQNQVAQAGNTLVFTLNCQDPDSGDTVTLTYTKPPQLDWLTAIPPDNPIDGNPITITFTGTPQASHEGQYTMTFNAVDDGAPQQNALKDITITVTTTNNPPVLDPIRNKEVPIRVNLEFVINATDADNDVLTYSASGLPFSIGATFNSSTRRFSWTPTNSQVGSYNVHFEVSDATSSDSEDITIYVTADDAPRFDPLFDKYIKVNKTLCFAVTARDPNNDPITYGAENIPTGAAFDSSTHTFTWTPQAGQEGTYKVMFTVSDGTYTTNKEIWIIVQPISAPQLKPVGDKYVRAGETLSFTLEATDPDTPLNQLEYSVSNNPAGSSLIGPNFTWTPTSAQVGTYRDVVFTVSDGTYLDSTDLWIFVLSNGAPIIERIGDKHVVEGRTLSFTVNATDPDGDALTYLQPTNAPKGSYFDSSTRTFTWTPAFGERGVYNDIIFMVSDGVNTVSDNVWLFVDANDAPIVEPLSEQHIKAEETLSFAISAYDPNGDSLTYRALNLPSGATFIDRTFRWTPTISQAGTYKDIIFEISDGVNVVTTRTWIFVTEPGAPVMERVGDQYITAGQTLTFSVNATDPDNNPLTYTASNLPSGAAFDPLTRTFTWTPALSQVGTYPDVLFNVTDGTYTDTQICWMFVRAQGAPLIELPGEQRVRADSTLDFTVTAADPNTSASELTYSASNLPPGATFSNQLFRWTPTAEQIGTYPDIIFTVSDGTYTDSNVIWIFVTSPTAPEFREDIKSKDGKIGEPLTFTIQPAEDPDNTDAQLTYYGLNLPLGATFLDRTFRWTPDENQAGTYKNVRFEVKDPDNNIDSDIFWLFVAGNTPPEMDFIGTRYGNVGQPLTFMVSASDYDNDPLTYRASNLPGGAAFNPTTRTFSWTPSAEGTYTGVHFEVSDGRATDSEDITIIVSP